MTQNRDRERSDALLDELVRIKSEADRVPEEVRAIIDAYDITDPNAYDRPTDCVADALLCEVIRLYVIVGVSL